MNNFTKNKLVTAAIILLLIVNLVTLSTIWFMKENGPPLPPQQNGAFDFIVKELQFTPEQVKAYEALRNEHQQQSQQIRIQIGRSKDSLFGLLKETNISDSILQKASMVGAVLQASLDMLTFEHFKKVRALCTPEQQAKFDQIIQQVMNMIAPPKNPGGPGGVPPRRQNRPGNEPAPRL